MVLFLVSVYGPVSRAGFDQERRVMFFFSLSLSTVLGLLPFRSVLVVGAILVLRWAFGG